MLPGGGPSGFYNAPVTKAIIFSLGFNTLLATMLDIRHKWHLQLYPHLFVHYQYWRLLTTNLLFPTTSTLLFGSLLLYHFRVLERTWSSNKYAAFAFVSIVCSTLLNVGVMVLARWSGIKAVAKIPIGPFGLVFAGLYQYLRAVPEPVEARGAGRGMIMLLGGQLLLSSFPESLVVSGCGLLAGAIYEANVGEIKAWRFPRLLQAMARKLVLPLVASATPQDRPSGTTIEDQMRERRERYAASMRGMGGSTAHRVAMAGPPPPPSPDAVAVLEGMGFSRERVLVALRSSNNDVQRAAAALLDSRD
ncbi:hypothetical protein SpCBS45565_g00010 [Spizellomyces sp. 'palustris']|nr:hypothetical protein SpCBS45565_g00010 [Spizellomyces sp. 'palustris']